MGALLVKPYTVLVLVRTDAEVRLLERASKLVRMWLEVVLDDQTKLVNIAA